MGRNVGRISAALVSVVALAIGILDLVHVWPRWVWIGLGVVGLIAIVGQFFWEHRGDDEQPAPRVKQRQKGGRKSRNYQAGRDIRLSDDGPDEQR